MHMLFKIITCCLVKNFLVCAAFLWILCESRHVLGIGTRLDAISDGVLLHTYTTGMKPPGGVVNGYSDTEHDQSGFDKPIIPTAVWIFMIVVLFFFIVLCIWSCMNFQIRRARLWANVNANPNQPRPQTSPPVPQEDIRTPVGDIDVPPDYTAVVDQKIMAADDSDSLNHYPKVVRGKYLETPPPAYMTVAPFK